jgi:hypothetical protein
MGSITADTNVRCYIRNLNDQALHILGKSSRRIHGVLHYLSSENVREATDPEEPAPRAMGVGFSCFSD